MKDRIIDKKYDDVLELEYRYNDNNKVSSQKDNINGVNNNYEYDEDGRLY